MVLNKKKVVWKFIKAAVYVVIAGLAVIYGNSPYYLAIAPALHSLENWIKHR